MCLWEARFGSGSAWGRGLLGGGWKVGSNYNKTVNGAKKYIKKEKARTLRVE